MAVWSLSTQILMKKSSSILTVCLSLVFALGVFLFWRIGYPQALSFQEQFQLFLFDGDYLRERLCVPNGLARYLAEFLVQFYNNVTLGAVILAVLLTLVQRLSWRLMPTSAIAHYPLSFLPPLLLLLALGDENVLLTSVVSLLIVMGACVMWRTLVVGRDRGRVLPMAVVLIAVPLLYWMAGPLVVLFALYAMPVSVVYAVLVVLLSSYVLPYPLSQLMMGVGYYRFTQTLPLLLLSVPVAILLLAWLARFLPRQWRFMPWVETAVLAVLAVVALPGAFDAKKYELMDYDYLVRQHKWSAIVAKAEQQQPDLPLSVCATNMALALQNQLCERAFDFYQHGAEGLVMPFERNFISTQVMSDLYFNLGLVNTSQRFAFESMEALPDYSKSARSVRRLVETNIINGQYAVAEKYIAMLEQTVFYRKWARQMRLLLGNETAIASHPAYGWLRKVCLPDDVLFSEDEVDKICGRLFSHNPHNAMAMQYMLMHPLLQRDLQRFMDYTQYVGRRADIRVPRACQEAIVMAYASRHQMPPEGLVSPQTVQLFKAFTRAYSSHAPTDAYRNTVWYYLTIE